MTNAEKITEDTTHLAEMIWLTKTPSCNYCIYRDDDCLKQKDGCRVGIRKWLESEAEDDERRKDDERYGTFGETD